jgi:hypothetical protein
MKSYVDAANTSMKSYVDAENTSMKSYVDAANTSLKNYSDATFYTRNGGTINGNVTISGDLIINGNTTTVNTSTVQTSDSLIKLANNNTVGDTLDIGFYGQSNNGTTIVYHGLVRRAGDDYFLFKNLPNDPTGNVLATGSVTRANTGTLRANVTGGMVFALANTIGIVDGGTNNSTFNTGALINYDGSKLASLANTGTSGTYGNNSHYPIITTDAYGRVSSASNTLIQIDASQITSGTISNNRISGTYTISTLNSTTISVGSIAVQSNTFTTSSTSQVTVDSFLTSTYRTAKYVAQMTSGSTYHSIEMLIIHDGTNVYMTQYAEINTGSSLGTFDATISSGILNLLFTPTNATTTVSVMKNLISV